jgi:hypothetical protein
VRNAFVVAGLLGAVSLATPLRAQRDGVQLDIAVNPAVALQEGPTITTANLLADANTRELLRNGFATRIHFRLELWRKSGFFDDRSGRTEWEILVQQDPTTHLYSAVRRQDNQVTESFGESATVTSAEAQFDRPFRTSLHPVRSGRYYYNLIVEVQTLTETDLDALQQWLRGPTAPQKSNPITAIRSGIGRLFSRMLGGGKLHYQSRSGVFDVP